MNILNKIKYQIKSMIGRVIIDAVTTKDNIQRLNIKGLDEEFFSNVLHFQQYGFKSKPLKGCEGIALSVNANRDHVVIIATDDKRFSIELQDGEAALYNDKGQKIVLKQDGTIELDKDMFEKILNGETFKNWVDNHKHSVMVPSTPITVESSSPISSSPASVLSSQIKAGI